jgi:hypothetical protein
MYKRQCHRGIEADEGIDDKEKPYQQRQIIVFIRIKPYVLLYAAVPYMRSSF